MNWLPFNIARLQTLRTAVAVPLIAVAVVVALFVVWLIGAPPVGLAHVPAVRELAALVAVPASQVVESLHALLVFTAALLAYTAAWLLSLVSLVFVGRRRCTDMRRTFLGGSLPKDWERADAAQRLNTFERGQRMAWAWMRRIGAMRFIVGRGLAFGLFAFLFIHLASQWVRGQPVVVASLPIKCAFWVLLGLGLTATRWWQLRRLYSHAEPHETDVGARPLFSVYAANTLVGHSALESGDPPMGVAFGSFIPAPGYEAIRGFCSSQHDDQADLQLTVRTPHNDTIACAGVGILDFSAQVGEETIEINVLGIASPPYEALFPHHVAAYERQFR